MEELCPRKKQAHGEGKPMEEVCPRKKQAHEESKPTAGSAIKKLGLV